MKEQESIQQPWIKTGYHTFAYEGPHGLKVERLARTVGKSKSSFYHHFADLEVFTSALLEHHLQRAEELAEKEAACTSLEELIAVLLEFKIDLLFSRQLRVHRENREFEQCFVRTNEMALPAIIPIWSKVIGLEGDSYLARLVFQLSIENFFLQLTDETIEKAWLFQYFQSIRNLVTQFRNSGVASLDGAV